jgi:hypothetical protein
VFDLEQAILEWRRRMLDAGVKSPAPLEELESHLREDIERQIQAGTSAEQAVAIAAQRFGQAETLQREFAKARANKETRWRRVKQALGRFIGIPVTSPIALSAGSREILELGGKEALGFHHDFIGTEHVLLGLLEAKAGVVRGVLQKMGVDDKIVRSEIEKVVGNGPEQQTGRTLRYTPRVTKALELAGTEARGMKQNEVGVEHIFLGLLGEGSGVAALVLKNLGVNIQTARQEILRELGGRQSGI